MATFTILSKRPALHLVYYRMMESGLGVFKILLFSKLAPNYADSLLSFWFTTLLWIPIQCCGNNAKTIFVMTFNIISKIPQHLPHPTQEQIYDYGLYHIAGALQRCGKRIQDFDIQHLDHR